jgi:UDP-N-acetylglucosamine 2-epimerase (non-hydrolysing)
VERDRILSRFELASDGFVLATFHRPENVDDCARLHGILRDLASLPMPVLLPLHPRTAATARAFGLEHDLEAIGVVPPLGYREVLGLASEAAAIVTDSGGLVEEASVLKRPVVLVRNSTERPEVLGTFCDLVAAGSDAMVSRVEQLIRDPAAVRASLATIGSPFGDGTASARCIDAMRERVGLPV